ncbi:uncharacterized protein [Drosophila takahashii]|uniref:uncharacterized protein n=1 Tax=Drosophila takahashii TaxID=29030 RepID=UPI0038991A78
MGKPVRFFSQNSNQPLEADFNLEEQMFQRSQKKYNFSSSEDSNRAYMRYMKTLVRVQNSIHRRFHSRSSRISQAHHTRISAGGSAKDSDKSSQELKNNSQCCDQQKELPCEAAKPSKQADCLSNNKPVESPSPCNKKSSKNSESSCSSKPEPVKSTCCDAPVNQRKSCVSFEQPVAKDIPNFDPPFRNCPCTDPDKRHLPIIGVCCSQESFKEIQKDCTAETARDPPPQRIRNQSARRCCSRPIIVVPAGEGTRRYKKAQDEQNSKIVTQDHSKNDTTPNSKEKSQPKSQPLEKPYNPTPKYGNSSVEHQKTCPVSNCKPNEPTHSKCQCTNQSKDCHIEEKPHCSMNPPPCSNCPAISDITKQLSEMNRRLEGLQSHELSDIRTQVDSLNANVQSLTKKCIEKKSACKKLERKPSSTCQFCQGKRLTQLDSFHRQLMDLIGDRCLTDIVISIFLRADNLYHVNVRDLSSGCSLGCFLVTDAAIEEAVQLGVFQEILTFSVIDVRNTIKPKNCSLGLSFEFHHADRQCGGCDHKAGGICLVGREYVARVLGLPLQQLKYVNSIPENLTKDSENKSCKSKKRNKKISGKEIKSKSGHRKSVQDDQFILPHDEHKNPLSELQTTSTSVDCQVQKTKRKYDSRLIPPTRDQFFKRSHKKIACG